jgi:hypothetical protein
MRRIAKENGKRKGERVEGGRSGSGEVLRRSAVRRGRCLGKREGLFEAKVRELG